MRLLMALAILGLAGALIVIELGLPDVAATNPHWKVTEWVLSTTMDRSVKRHAAGISVPEDLGDPRRVQNGVGEYHAMCQGCHGGPDVKPGLLAKGLLPEPPEMEEAVGDWSPAELFWITKHGVRMTGMPAFGPTHTDAQIWDVVAFLRRFTGISGSEYQRMVEAAEAAGGHHEHEH